MVEDLGGYIMPIVRIDLWKGRDREAKSRLISNVTSAVCDSIGCPKDAVQVIINDVEKSGWGIGGESASKKFPDK